MLHPKGTLYLAATPIGNLEDMTFRAVRILQEAPLIAAEDTRHTRKLLARYDIHTRLTSYHEHNKLEKGPRLVDFLVEGHDLVCVSDAGLPGIADPGGHLAELAIAAGVQVSPLPGANAALSALICSGLDARRFTFIGFLPRTAAKSRELLAEIAARRETLIFYEAPHHLKNTLKALIAAFGASRSAVAARELTKRYEEFRRGTLSDILAHYSEEEPRGEFVLIVAGAEESAVKENALTETPKELVTYFMEEGRTKKEALRETAKRLNMSRRDVYQILLEE
ncbi:16S rRNA (cytidine(1402)-2'-O)-methyltransferase [Selenomonas sp.]|uniref:16S rRNA (cytidine(1402)-2'-O)-methyltransferase n=1 Tax=Selenomonas sp. TaxID=2053611 RepID=UPI003FA1BD7D